MSARFWRFIAWLFGRIGDWAQEIHDDLHRTDDPGCKGCEIRAGLR